MISVLVLTLNEENNLPGCLETVQWSDDIHVLDSHSIDRTVEIAKQYGATVWFRKFDSFSQHQNWALENIPFKHPWVFYFDADERVTPATGPIDAGGSGTARTECCLPRAAPRFFSGNVAQARADDRFLRSSLPA